MHRNNPGAVKQVDEELEVIESGSMEAEVHKNPSICFHRLNHYMPSANEKIVPLPKIWYMDMAKHTVILSKYFMQ